MKGDRYKDKTQHFKTAKLQTGKNLKFTKLYINIYARFGLI